MNSINQNIPSTKSQLIKSIKKHHVDIAVLKEREDRLLSMINMLESLMPFATVWYMWKFALASRADPESRPYIEEEAKQKLSRLLTALEELKKEAAQVKSARDSGPLSVEERTGPVSPDKFSLPHDRLEKPPYKQIEPTLKPGSHELLVKHTASVVPRIPSTVVKEPTTLQAKPFLTEPSEILASKSPSESSYKGAPRAKTLPTATLEQLESKKRSAYPDSVSQRAKTLTSEPSEHWASKKQSEYPDTEAQRTKTLPTEPSEHSTSKKLSEYPNTGAQRSKTMSTEPSEHSVSKKQSEYPDTEAQRAKMLPTESSEHSTSKKLSEYPNTGAQRSKTLSAEPSEHSVSKKQTEDPDIEAQRAETLSTEPSKHSASTKQTEYPDTGVQHAQKLPTEPSEHFAPKNPSDYPDSEAVRTKTLPNKLSESSESPNIKTSSTKTMPKKPSEHSVSKKLPEYPATLPIDPLKSSGSSPHKPFDTIFKPVSPVIKAESPASEEAKIPMAKDVREKGSKPASRSGTTLASKAPSRDRSRSSIEGSHPTTHLKEPSKVLRGNLSTSEAYPIDGPQSPSYSKSKRSLEDTPLSTNYSTEPSERSVSKRQLESPGTEASPATSPFTEPSEKVEPSPQEQIVTEPSEKVESPPQEQIVTKPSEEVESSPQEQIEPILKPESHDQLYKPPPPRTARIPSRRVDLERSPPLTNTLPKDPSEQSVSKGQLESPGTEASPAKSPFTEPSEKVESSPQDQIVTEPSEEVESYPQKQIEPTLKPGSHDQLADAGAPRIARVPLRRAVRERGPPLTVALPKDPSEQSVSKGLPESDPWEKERLPDKSQPLGGGSEKSSVPTDAIRNGKKINDGELGPYKEQKPKMAEGPRNRSRVVREVIEIHRDGQAPEKIEVQPGMDVPQTKAVEELIRKLDNERDNLQGEMDRIFGPLPAALARPGGPGAGRPTKNKKGSAPDPRDKSPESGEATPSRQPASGKTRTPRGHGRNADPSPSDEDLASTPGGKGRGREAPPSLPVSGLGSPMGRGRGSPQARPDSSRSPSPTQREPWLAPDESPMGRGRGSPQARPDSSRSPSPTQREPWLEPDGSPMGRGRGSPQARPDSSRSPSPTQREPWLAPDGSPMGRGRGSPQARPDSSRSPSPTQREPWLAPDGSPMGRGRGSPQARPDSSRSPSPTQREPWLAPDVAPYGGSPNSQRPPGQGAPGTGTPGQAQGGPNQMGPYGQGAPYNQGMPFGQNMPAPVQTSTGSPASPPPFQPEGMGMDNANPQTSPGTTSPSIPDQPVPPSQMNQGMGMDNANPQTSPGTTSPSTPDQPVPPSQMNQEEIPQKIDMILNRLDWLASQFEKQDAERRAAKEQASRVELDDELSDDESEDFAEQLDKLHEKITEGIQRVEEVIENEARRRQQLQGM